MPYRILADIIVLIHLLFIVFVISGGVLGFYRKWTVWVHIPAAVWGALVELTGWICPLTPLENKFRISQGLQGYGGGFIDHYLIPIIYPDNLTRNIQILLGIAVVIINGVIYYFLIKKYKNASLKPTCARQSLTPEKSE
jgi:hypothetical protein